MNNTDQIHQLILNIAIIADNRELNDENRDFLRIVKLAIKALALLPCKTCNGTGYELEPEYNGVQIPCPDCQLTTTEQGEQQSHQ